MTPPQVWVRHPDPDVGDALVHESAVPILAASGWVRMTSQQVAAKQRQLAAQRAADEAVLTPRPPTLPQTPEPAELAEHDDTEPAPDPDVDTDADPDADGRQTEGDD